MSPRNEAPHIVAPPEPAPEAAPVKIAPADDPAPRGRRRLVLGGAAVAAALLAAGWGVHAWLHRGDETTDDAQVESDVVAVAPRVAGAVSRVLVRENQAVRKGDLLVEIDPADYAARVRQAEAEVATARAQAAAADAQVQVAEAAARGGLAGARASLAHAEAGARRANADLQRARELQKGGASTPAQLDAAEAAAALAEGQVGEARGKLEQSSPIGAQIAAAHAAADLAHARVKSAEAALELARLQLSYTKVVAPADGEVSRLSAREGQLVAAAQPLAQLVPSKSYVVANFKETQVGGMRPGQEVDVDVDAFGGHALHGKVESLSGGTGARFSLLPPDNASGNFVKVV
ncbi:MAG TPA: HlyD family secretion protein, partial [Anaeromyxobacteraceae bacterium]|nr:HlyD family secretion protein [Anaeromyxobacteraceae bacterium]